MSEYTPEKIKRLLIGPWGFDHVMLDLFLAYLDKELNPECGQIFEEHLKKCGFCRADLQGIMEVLSKS